MRLSSLSASVVIGCFLLVVLAGVVQGEENKRLMMVFTTDTSGELNPCG